MNLYITNDYTMRQVLAPVSYTHLDVYKRQELAREGALRAALLRDAVLLRRQLVPDGLRRGLLIVCLLYTSPLPSILLHSAWQLLGSVPSSASSCWRWP